MNSDMVNVNAVAS